MTPNTNPNPNTRDTWDELWPKVGVRFPEKEPVNARKKAVAAMVPKNVTVLNLACGVSQIMHLLDPSVKHIGLDFSREALARFPGTRIRADVRALPIRTHSIHTVIAMEILEHLDDPHSFLTDLYTIAREQIIVTVPHNRLKPGDYTMHRAAYTRAALYHIIRATIPSPNCAITTTPLNLIARITL